MRASTRVLRLEATMPNEVEVIIAIAKALGYRYVGRDGMDLFIQTPKGFELPR
jgi:hypothetical protein